MTDPHTRRGHDPVRAEEELDAIVKEMRVEAPSDEAGRHRIGNPIDGDGAVAGDIDGEYGEIGGSPCGQRLEYPAFCIDARSRSEEHTSELQSLMRISYAVFCLKKKKYHSIIMKHFSI